MLHQFLCFFLSLTTCQNAPAAVPFLERQEVHGFIQYMVTKHGMNADTLQQAFLQAQKQSVVLETIARPAESKEWHQYRPIFVNTQRVREGVSFWRENAALLAQAEQTFGVPAQVIVAIIGVETRFGRITGSFPVLDTLATLAFDYPPRSEFFRSELEQFFLLASEQNLTINDMRGSYAGAYGPAQFMPSSYRRYAVDFDKDGKVDMFHNYADVIGSVANYLKEKGWSKGGSIALPANIARTPFQEPAKIGLKTLYSLGELEAFGIQSAKTLPKSTKANLIRLQNEQKSEYWIGLHNFGVITKYNRSALYAMAVFQLAEETAKAYGLS